MEFDHDPIKLVFLGDTEVGKTSLLRRFNTGLPPKEIEVPIFDFADRIAVDGTSYHVNFWDIRTIEEDKLLRPLAYVGTDIFILCFDITNRVSFDNIKESWITEIHHYMSDTPFLLVGNKVDLRNNTETSDQVEVPVTVSNQEAWELAQLHDTSYIENSAVTGEQVGEVVHMAIRKVAYLHNSKNPRCRCRRQLFKWIKCKRHR